MRREAGRGKAKGGSGEKGRGRKGRKVDPATLHPPQPLQTPTQPLQASPSASASSSSIVSPFPPFALSPSPPTVAVVGAGRLGAALARALAACGYDVVAVVARRARHAARAASLTGAGTLALSAAQLRQLPAADYLFITTPDDEVQATATRLAELSLHASTAQNLASARASNSASTRASSSVSTRATNSASTGVSNSASTPASRFASIRASTSARSPASARVRANAVRVALHTSGALSSDALAPLRAAGFAVGSMHPLVAVSEPVAGAESLRRAFYCIEGERRALSAARRLVGRLGGRSFSIETKDKSLYHAAAVIASGHTVALFQLATELLARCGLDAERARRVLLPLLESTLANLSAQPPARALTGTFARADVTTVRRHLAALAEQSAPPRTTRASTHADTNDTSDALAIYALLGRRALRLAAQNRALDPAALREIARALDDIPADVKRRRSRKAGIRRQ